MGHDLPTRWLRRLAPGAAVLALLAGAARAAGDETSLWHLGPEDIGGPAGYGREIDDLYVVILWIVVVAFVLTQGILLWFLFRYRAKPGGKAIYTHGNHRLEVIWTIVPAVILLWLAFYQFGTWSRIKVHRPPAENGLVVQVMARQFEWRIRFAGPDGKFHTEDDVYGLKELHVPVNTDITVQLRSQDVLHAFFLPYLRLKQDTVPGMTINQWFRATKTTAQARIERGNPNFNFEIACAELCGLGHTTMRGTLVVDSEEDFYKWLDAQYVDSTLGFDNTDQLIYRFWPATENRMEDPWGAKHWPEELKAKWPK